jgi:hypothetical protein
MNNKRLVLVELNEINFEFAVAYAERGNLVNLKRVLNEGIRHTRSEARYQDLEPWIQWVSAHTGKTAAEHGISRLGDIVGSDVPQFFELIEAAGYTVGSVSAMNVENRLQKPAYFIPDPWTATPSDVSFWSKVLAKAVSQAVNDNATGRLTATSILALLGGMLRFARPCNYSLYMDLAVGGRRTPWRKALFLDLFLHDIHLRLFRRRQPNFSTIFLNAGAHIQHHYFFNVREVIKTGIRNPDWYVPSDRDPFAEMLKVYDRIIGDYLAMDDVDLILATGLTQRPYNDLTYYWRLKDHEMFMRYVGVNSRAVCPRMDREFLLEFDSPDAAAQGARKLSDIVCEGDGKPIFGEIDNRGTSLYVTLTYPDAIEHGMRAKYEGGSFDLKAHVVFVAIKNGMHDAKGFIYYKGDVANYAAKDGLHIKELYNVVVRYFGLSGQGN